MDVKLYGRVAWRFKWLLLLTVVLAAAAAVLSTNNVSFAQGGPKLTPRGTQTWSSSSVILVTQHGFPWGRSVFPVLPAPDKKAITPNYADPSRFSGLALLYVQLANGNDFNRVLGPVPGTLHANPVLPSSDSSVSQALPLIEFDATANKPELATSIADRAAAAFEKFLADRQDAAAIPDSQRVDLEPVTLHARAQLLTAKKKTVPILIFTIILAGGFGLALALENARPRTLKDQPIGAELSPAGREAASAESKAARSA